MTTTEHGPGRYSWTALFLEELRQGASVRAAARAAKVALSSAYAHRQRDLRFACEWDAALPPGVKCRAKPPGWRRAGERKLDRFLSALAETSNVTAAAAAAGITPGYAYGLRRSDAAFAARWYEALSEGYDNLELELLEYLRGGGSAREGAKFDTAVALRSLIAHRDAVIREKGRRSLADEAVTIEVINARIDALRLRRRENDRAIAEARDELAEQKKRHGGH